MTVGLLQVIRTVIAADSGPIRQVLFEKLRQSRLDVRVASALHHRWRGTRTAGAIVASVGLVSYLGVAFPRNRAAAVHVVASLPNARRRTTDIAALIGASNCGWVRTGLRFVATPEGLFALGRLIRTKHRRVPRFIRVVDRKHGFLVACRALVAVAWYVRGRQMLATRRPSAVLVASDTNPEELGYVAAARASGVAQVFATHAFGSPGSPPLRYSLSVLDGPADLAIRTVHAPATGAVVFAGGEGDSAVMDPSRLRRPNPVIGIFLPNAVCWASVITLIEACARRFAPRRILIRRHPSAVEPTRLGDVRCAGVELVDVAGTASAQDDARRCDWVMVDLNSMAPLRVLKCGVPTVAIRGLELPPGHRDDPYGFVAGGLVFPPPSSVDELDLDEVATFLTGEWEARFRHFDASYLQPPHVAADEVRRAMAALSIGGVNMRQR